MSYHGDQHLGYVGNPTQHASRAHVEATKGRATMQPNRRNIRSELFVSLVIAVAVTIIFVGQTIVRWPDPMQLSRFHLELSNPFSGMFR